MRITEIDSKQWNTSPRNDKLYEFQGQEICQSRNGENTRKSLIPFHNGRNGHLKSKVPEMYGNATRRSNRSNVKNDYSSKLPHVDSDAYEIQSFSQKSFFGRVTKSCKSYYEDNNGRRVQIMSASYFLSVTSGSYSTFQCSSRKRKHATNLDSFYDFINNEVDAKREHIVPSKKAKSEPVQKFYEADTEPGNILRSFEADDELEEEMVLPCFDKSNQESFLEKFASSCKNFFGSNNVSRL